MKADSSFSKLTQILLAGIFVCMVLLVWENWPRETGSPNNKRAAVEEATQDDLDSPPPLRRARRTRSPAPPAAELSLPNSALTDNEVAATEPAIETQTALVGLQAALGRGPDKKRAAEVAPEPDIIVAQGGIQGHIRLEGKPPPETTLPLDAICGKRYKEPPTTQHYVVGEHGALADVVVYVEEGLPDRRWGQGHDVQTLRNKKCMFEPYIMAMQTDQTLLIINSDPILHNVHTTPKINHEINLGLPIQFSSTKTSFPQAEEFVRIKCDVHPWMFAYVSVFDHPYFAVSDTDVDGNYHIPYDLPKGRYVLAAVHRKAGKLTREVDVIQGHTLEVDFTFRVPKSDESAMAKTRGSN